MTEFVALVPSRWFTRVLRAHPEWAPLIAELAAAPLDGAALDALLLRIRGGTSYADGVHVARVLRQVRNLWLCAVMERDLAGRASLTEVVQAASLLADRAISDALGVAGRELSARHGPPMAAGVPQDLMVVAMGKLGGRELNVSSDVDLVFVYAEEGETSAAEGQRALSNQEFFTRLGRRVIALLAEGSADGFVFRVDMRLRPNGDAGPLAVSLAMLEEYFIVQGRPWERFAWIKARAIAPAVFGTDTHAAIDSLHAIVTPFVYRRYLDFGAIEALRALHGQIRTEVARRDVGRPDAPRNVKLGRGGIREIEFLVQHFQLVRGGREVQLRLRGTVETLHCLVALRLIEPDIAAHLCEAYTLLRQVEHRAQYRDDAQTHLVPVAGEEAQAMATMCASLVGAATPAALAERLATEQAFVATQFDEVFGARATVASGQGAGVALWSEFACAGGLEATVASELVDHGFADAASAQARLRALWNSSVLRGLGAAQRERLDALMPLVIERAARGATVTCSAADLLGRLCDLIEAIAKRGSYIALLIEYPQALDHVTKLLGASPWAARYLTQHPLLLDELLDLRNHERLDVATLRARLAADLAQAGGDAERGMDILREVQHLESFRLLIQDLESELTVEALSDDLSALADAIIEAAIAACWAILGGDAAAPPVFGVIAYGKLGGKELGYTSDLDLVFLYDETRIDEGGALRHARLGQRLMTWLTSRTPAGGLFDVDVRLRPEGAAGLLVTSCAAFEAYQRDHAWVWEHQALTRARACAGDHGVAARFEAERRAILARVRELAELRREVSEMRQRMHQGHPNPGHDFDLKHDRGGMVDIEFCVQFLVLAYSHRYPELLENHGNIALLGYAARAGLIDEARALQCADAYRAYRRRTHALRLAEARYARVEPGDFVTERAAVRALCQELELSMEGESPA